MGSHLAERLVDSGYDVICLDNFLTGTVANLASLADDPRFELVDSDVSQGLRVPGPVDAVLHLASPASPADYLRFPVETLQVGSAGTLHALELSRRKQARFLLASTSEAYGDPQVHPQPESYWGNVNPVGPRAVYDEAKRFAEAATTAYRTRHGVRTGIVRIFNTYGPRMRSDDGRMVPTFIGQALRGEALTVTGTGRQTRSVCYVDDTVDGLLRMLHSEHAGPINIGNPVELTVLAVAELIRGLTGSRSPVTFVPRPQDDPELRRPDIALARSALGWDPRVGIEDGLSRTIAWFRSGRVADGSAEVRQGRDAASL